MKLLRHKQFSLLAIWLAGFAIALHAQQTVIVDKPLDTSAEKANNFLDKRAGQMNPDSFKAPQKSSFDTATVPPPKAFYFQKNNAAQDALNKRKNWTLLTPEQILGIQTPEQIMGVDDPKGEKKLPLEQQYLLRQSRINSTNSRALSALLRGDSSNPFDSKSARDKKRSIFGSPTDSPDNQEKTGMNPAPNGAGKYFDELKRAAAWDAFSAPKPEETSPWDSPFARPDAPKQSTEQIASMERFRAMMQPTTPPDNNSQVDKWAAPAKKPADPYLQPVLKVNPVGSGVTSLADSAGHPTGIQPLPGITGQPKPAQTTRPSWQAQPPPWLSDKPQPRKF